MSKVIKERTDLRYLNFSIDSKTSGTTGTLLKAEDIQNNKKVYYKLSNYNYDLGIIGHESVNEVIVDRLLQLFGFNHLSYDLINADVYIDGKTINTYLCSSIDFKKEGDSKVALDVFYQIKKLEDESIIEFCKRYGFIDEVYKILISDFLILNRDRHGTHVEVIYNKFNDTYRLSPIFDNGLSLLFSCNSEKQIDEFDIYEDKKVQCFFGTNSGKENLNIIPKNKLIKLNNLNKEFIFKDMDGIISEKHIDKIYKLIKERYDYYESIRFKK